MTTAGDEARQAVLGISGRLEPLWREASARIATRPEREPTPESDCWDTAAELLEDAMTALERFSATVDPGLARRDWTSRRPS